MSGAHENHKPNSDAVDPVERALSGFSPSPPQIDRDRLMFLAGQASVACQEPGVADQGPEHTVGLPRRFTPHWIWPASSAILAATSIGLLVTLATRPTPRTQVVYRDRPAAAIVASVPRHTQGPGIEREAGYAAQPVVREATWVRVPQDNYVRTREIALRMGLDAIGSPSALGSGQSAPATYGALLEGLAGAGQWPASSPRLENSPNM